MSIQSRITELAQAIAVDVKKVLPIAPQAGDLAFSANPGRYSLPDWIPCNGSILDNATAPASLSDYMVQTSETNYVADLSVESLGAAPSGVFDMTNDYVMMQMAATPFAIPMRVASSGLSYTRESFAVAPSAALKCAALGVSGANIPNVLGFTTTAGGSFFARGISSAWSITNVSSIFTGKTVAGVVFGADNRFYLLTSTAPYLHSIDGSVSGATLDDVGGVHASGVGLAISPNKKYMVSWHSATPFLNVFEFNGTKYVHIGSPPTSAASYARVEVSNNGVIVGKPANGSVYHICSVTPSGGVSGMTLSTVNAATAWGISPDGRWLLSWLSSAMSANPIVNNSVGVATSISMYTSAAYGTIAGRFGLIPGKIVTGSSTAASGYAMVGTVPLTGWMTPRIKNGFMKT